MHARSASAALVLCLAAFPTQAKESSIAYQKSTGTQVFAEVKGDRILFRSLGPSRVSVGYDFDADANGRIDKAVDVSYGFHQDGSLCAATWNAENATSYCGQLRTAARVSQETIGEQLLRRFDVPLSEVARNGRSLTLRLGMYDSVAKSMHYAWLSYDLATGAVTNIPAPSANPAGTATAAKPATGSTPSPAIGPTPSERDLSDRFDAGKEWTYRQCKYRKLPEVRLLKDINGAQGEFLVRPAESSSIFNNELRVTIAPGRQPKLRLVTSDRIHQQGKITAAMLVVDGGAYSLEVSHPFDRIGPPMTYQPYATIDYAPAAVIEALAASRTATLVLMAKGGGTVSRWTFPVGNLRYLQRAMEASKWTCPGW